MVHHSQEALDDVFSAIADPTPTRRGDGPRMERHAYRLRNGGRRPGTVLRFTHAGWKPETDYSVSCNTTWGDQSGIGDCPRCWRRACWRRAQSGLGWEAGTRTPIRRSRVCSLTIRRPPRTLTILTSRPLAEFTALEKLDAHVLEPIGLLV
jgi:hypothetical protein